MPPPVMETVAYLLAVDVFSELAVTVTVPLSEPLVGETVSQLALSLTVQSVFEVISKLPELPEL